MIYFFIKNVCQKYTKFSNPEPYKKQFEKHKSNKETIKRLSGTKELR